MQYYRNYLIGVLIFSPISALVAKAVARIFGFDVRYPVALGSTLVGYFLVMLSGMILGFGLGLRLSVELRLLAGFCLMALAHAILLRSQDKTRLGLPKSILIAAAQLATGLVILFAANSAMAR